MRVFNQARILCRKAFNARTAVALTGISFWSATAYCRSRPNVLTLPEGETWESLLNKCFPADLDEITREEARVAFKLLGFKNTHLADVVFTAMDLNNDGTLTKTEILEVTKLLNSGQDKGVARFLFNAVDADHNKRISRQELQNVLYSLLETKFMIERVGLRDDIPTYFENFTDSDFQAYAKYCSNRLCEDIFNYADSNRDNKLSFSEFFRWYRRGGSQVIVIQGVLDDLISDFNDCRAKAAKEESLF